MKITAHQATLLKALKDGSKRLSYGDKITARALAKRGLLTIEQKLERCEAPACNDPFKVSRAKLTDLGLAVTSTLF